MIIYNYQFGELAQLVRATESNSELTKVVEQTQTILQLSASPN